MKMTEKTVSTALSILVCVLAMLGTAENTFAAVDLMDGKLRINGFLKETVYIRTAMREREKKFHDNAFDFANAVFFIEGLYDLYNNDDLQIKLFAGVRYWYEHSHYLDEHADRYIAQRNRKDYKHPRSFDEDMLTEAYVDIMKGPWQIRIGKQIVQWGQLDTNRVADVVNPMDLRHGVPGVDAWEEIKRGVWMIRTFYQSELPGNLLFEFIFNPGDFKRMRLPYEGTHWGPESYKYKGFNPEKEMGMWAYMQEKMWDRDAPTWDLSENYEFGGRISGYTWGVDWTLLYWNHLSDGPSGAYLGRANDFILEYVKAGIASSITNSRQQLPDWPSHRIYRYRRYQTIGGTAQTVWPWLHDTTWDLEWFYEIGSPLMKGTRGDSQSAYDGRARRDILGAAIKVSDRWRIPGITNTSVCADKKLEITFTYFLEKIFNHDHDLIVADRFHRPGDSVTDGCSLFLRQELFNCSWNLVFIGNYYFRIAKWMAVPCFTYVFPEWVLKGGLRGDIGAKLYGGARRNKVVSHAQDYKDSIILRLRYEF